MTAIHATKLADWNVVVTLPEQTFREARRMLGRWGSVARTGYHNVLVMRVANPDAFLTDFAAAVAESPGLLNLVSHVVPAQRAFSFETSEVFEREARATALGWLPDLADMSFYVSAASPRLEGGYLDAAGGALSR